MSTIYNTRCPLCQQEFRTRTAVRKHYRRHPGYDLPDNLKFFDVDEEVHFPQARELTELIKLEGYQEWLTELVDGLNSVHHPKAPGKWYSFQLTNVPLSYFEHLLFKIKSARPNSIKKVKHLKPPVWTEGTVLVSYKTTLMEDVLEALEEQKAILYTHKAFNGLEETENSENPGSQLYGKEALAAAKQPRSRRAVPPNLRSEIIIGEGEGRASRELEMKWMPIYSNSSNGILVFRIYIGKISL